MERFAFLDTGAAGVAESYDAGSKLVGSTLEAKTGACGGLEEECCDDLVAENTLLRILLKSLGYVQYLDVFFFREVGDGDEVASF